MTKHVGGGYGQGQRANFALEMEYPSLRQTSDHATEMYYHHGEVYLARARIVILHHRLADAVIVGNVGGQQRLCARSKSAQDANNYCALQHCIGELLGVCYC